MKVFNAILTMGLSIALVGPAFATSKSHNLKVRTCGVSGTVNSCSIGFSTGSDTAKLSFAAFIVPKGTTTVICNYSTENEEVTGFSGADGDFIGGTIASGILSGKLKEPSTGLVNGSLAFGVSDSNPFKSHRVSFSNCHGVQ